MTEPLLPKRLFDEGKEPCGERVHYYGDLDIIDELARVLDVSELETIRKSQFGKLLDIPIDPTYSGKLVHFMLTRQLVIEKKHEFWFIFAGRPIRFSLHEFAAVTGLNCGNLPRVKQRKSKRKITPGPYWFELFGRTSDVTASWVVSRLKRRLVTDSDMRIRYALLALIDGVLCPISGNLTISFSHEELTQDLDALLSHPWGTISFDMTLQSISAKGPAKLRKKSVTVQGFPHGLQLVLLHAVPAIRELQLPVLESDSDSDIEYVPPEIERLYSLKLVSIWELDREASCEVQSIVSAEADDGNIVVVQWPDEVDDMTVGTLLQLLQSNHKFTASMFVGGLLPGEAVEILNKDTDSSSNDEVEFVHEPVRAAAVRTKCKKMKKKGKRTVTDAVATEAYVNTKIKIVETKLLKAISDLETKLLNPSPPNIDRSRPNTRPTAKKLVATTKVSGTTKTAKVAIVKEMGSLREELLGTVANGDGTSRKRKLRQTRESMSDEDIIASVVRSVSQTKESSDMKRSKSETGTARKGTPPGDGVSVEINQAHCEDRPGGGIQAQLGHPQKLEEPTNVMGPTETTNPEEVTDFGDQVEVEVPPGDKVNDAERRFILVPFDTTYDEDLPVNVDQPNAQVLPCGPLIGDFPGIDPIADPARTSVQPNMMVQTNTEDLQKTVDGNNTPDQGHQENVLQFQPLSNIKGNSSLSSAIVPLHHNFGYNVEDLEKISRITLTNGYIDFGGGRCLTSSEVREIFQIREVLPPLAMNIFINSLKTSQEIMSTIMGTARIAFVDWDFVVRLSKHFPKFTKSTDKGMYAFDDYLLRHCPTASLVVYLPFSFDMHHWVGLCVNLEKSTITVFDSYTSFWRESKIKTYLTPIAEMLPYLVHYARDRSGKKKISYMALVVEREKAVPQVCFAKHSGIRTVSLLKAHAMGGVDACKLLKSCDVFGDVKKYIIAAYEATNNPI